MRTIKIGDSAYKYRFGLAAMMLHEQLTGKPFSADGTVTSYVAIHYSCLATADDEFILSFAEFVQAVDAQALATLGEALEAELKRWNVRNAVDTEGAPAKKK